MAGLTAVLCVAFAWFGAIFLRPFLRLFVSSRGAENDVVGYVLSSFGVLYGILLGLTAVAAYQNWSLVDANLTREASALVSTFQAVSSFPEPERDELRQALIDLAEFELNEEWPRLMQGLPTSGGRDMTDAIQIKLMAFEPDTRAYENAHVRAVDVFNEFLEQRRLRLYSSGTGIPSILWYVVIAGALINLILVWVLDTRLKVQFFLGGLLAFFLGTMILLIAVLSKPFLSNAGVSPAALQASYEFMTKD